MSIWSDFDIHSKLSHILASVQYNHHFGGRPFITAYQLAIEFANRYPADFALIGKPIGGEGTGVPNSFSQYIANELSQRIKAKTVVDIEGSFLGNLNLNSVTFNSSSGLVTSSLTNSSYPVSIFRLRNNDQASAD